MSTRPIHIAMAFLQWKEWPVQRTDDPNTIISTFAGHNGQWNLYAIQHPDREQLAFYSLFPHRFEAGALGSLLEFTARINAGIIMGNFEVLMEHGEIRFKTSIDLTDQTLNLKYCNPLVYYNLLAMDNHFKALQHIVCEHGNCETAMTLLAAET